MERHQYHAPSALLDSGLRGAQGLRGARRLRYWTNTLGRWRSRLWNTGKDDGGGPSCHQPLLLHYISSPLRAEIDGNFERNKEKTFYSTDTVCC